MSNLTGLPSMSSGVAVASPLTHAEAPFSRLPRPALSIDRTGSPVA